MPDTAEHVVFSTGQALVGRAVTASRTSTSRFATGNSMINLWSQESEDLLGQQGWFAAAAIYG